MRNEFTTPVNSDLRANGTALSTRLHSLRRNTITFFILSHGIVWIGSKKSKICLDRIGSDLC